MEDIVCYCPICQGQLLFEDSKNVNAAYSAQPLSPKNFIVRIAKCWSIR